MKKHLISIFLTLALIISSNSVNATSNANNSLQINEVKSTLCDGIFSDIYATLDLERMYESNAPSDYAGIYADESGTLVLCVTEGNKYKYNKMLSNIVERQTVLTDSYSLKDNTSSVVKIEEKTYSYNLLNSIQDALDSHLDDFKIQQTAILQEKNILKITINDELMKEHITNYLYENIVGFEPDAVCYVFSESRAVAPKPNHACNGVKFYHALFASSYGTLGFNGKYIDSSGKTHYGVFTNAHVAPNGEKMKISALKTVGTTRFSYIGGSLDIAFVEFNSGWEVTDRMLEESNSNGIFRAATADEFYEGALTNKYGATTGKQSGRVLSTSVSTRVEYDDGVKTINDVFEFSNKTEGGDSGGPVGKQKTREVFRLYGITFAGPKDGNDFGLGIKLSNIKKAYNIQVFGSDGWS